MNFPCTREQLKTYGYRFEFARKCKRCNQDLEFYRTPNKKLAPMEQVIVGDKWQMDSHFKTCVFRDDFRTAPPPAKKAAAKPKQKSLFEDPK